jgi:hypothetical protein
MSNCRLPDAAPDPGQSFSAEEFLDSPSAESGRRLPTWLSGLALAGFLVVLIVSLPTAVLDQAGSGTGHVATSTPASPLAALRPVSDANVGPLVPMCSTGSSHIRALIGCDRRREMTRAPGTACIAADQALRGSGASRAHPARGMRRSPPAPRPHRSSGLRRVTSTVDARPSS